jgi:heme exporter protein B
VWVAALLASMLTLPRLFAADHADGSLDQMLLSASPAGVIVAAKLTAHWLIAGLPLVVLSPLIALQFDLAADAAIALVWSLLVGTPILTLIGAIGAALTLGLRAGGLLLALLVLPLYVPVLILGAGSVAAGAAGLDTSGYYMLLGALLIAAAVLAPWAIAAALRWALE